jgi:hypothetical protein
MLLLNPSNCITRYTGGEWQVGNATLFRSLRINMSVFSGLMFILGFMFVMLRLTPDISGLRNF